MGEKSDSKKASSPYVVLENRPLDQWKVTELKEELKKRKLMTKGLKEELVKRLDEAVRAEMDEAKENLENAFNSEAPPVVQSDDEENATDAMDHTSGKDETSEKNTTVDESDNKTDEKTDVETGLDKVHTDDGLQSVAEKIVTEGEGVSTKVEVTQVVEKITVETTVMVTEESSEPKQERAEPDSSDLVSGEQVDEIDDSKSESVEVAEEKDNVIATDVKLGLDAKFENDSLKENVTAEKKYVDSSDDVDIIKKNDSGDVGSPEKLNLDRSSGDDSMEEDGLDSKQIDSKFGSDEVGNKNEKVEVKEDNSVDVMVEDATTDKDFVANEDKTRSSVTSAKRKPHDQEKAVDNNEVKRQRRWNSENLTVPKQQTNHSASTTPKDTFQNPFKHTFSRSESTKSPDLPKERVVPPSSKTPTTSLRIDNFLRPFTLKAVQEFLGKTGTIVSFWMDQIKTHCYITYASVEEAIETRNAVCNLQWPVNGGRLLMADFVDPQEVKNRVDPPPPSPATPATTTLPPPAATIPPPTATLQPPQPSPRLKQQLPPPPFLPPPPPLSNPPPARNRAPPPPEKVDPPIVTLDDLFKKTRATPRIYYLPLSDEQVAAKLNDQGKPANR
ncbi:putative transcription regulator SAP family [Helianthus annuus]|nr:putative transcription regulator SAP family [Helianthus annuus]